MRPVDIVRKVCPRARPNYLAAFEQGDHLFRKYGVTTPIRMAHFLAQVLHETGGLTIERENMNYTAKRIGQIFGVGVHSAKVTSSEAARLAGDPKGIAERVYGLGNPRKAKELGNTQPGDGYRFRGNGIMQTTGRGNHRRMGQKCGVDFESHPELVVSDEHALKPALAEWNEGKLNAKADVGAFNAITKRINGGYNGLADRRVWFNKVLPLCRDMTLDRADDDPPDVELPEPEIEFPEHKEPKKSKTLWAVVLGIITTVLGAVGDFLMDWKVAAVISATVLIGLFVFIGKERIQKIWDQGV
jgi:putative chitinase